jgi:prevent-host-death family protein
MAKTETTVDALEAKKHFSVLLVCVGRGESITITRHDKPVARLVPVAPATDRRRRAEAIAQIKEIGKRHTLGGLDWKALRDEGRK